MVKKVIVKGEVILDDKGTLKQTAKGAHSVDRSLKGAARASSNTTKNFSKMSQGISGGLVPAYATLAANIFAIGAAFRFLSDAADYRILVEGQREYATKTGEALELLTGRLQDATGGQLAFAEAAQSVAIARAAGVSSDQIERLGVLAKNASVALGRDLTDSLNRLIRGVTKAEPELLDELGIILRLEVASKKYAQELGKTKEQLTIFEKSQAVVNEVLDQGEEKFGNFNTSLNEFSKGAKKFDDLLNKIKGTVTVVAEFIAKGLSANMLALGASMGIVGSSILKSIIPAAQAIDRTKAGQAAMANVGKFYTGSRADKFADGTASQADVKAVKKSMKVTDAGRRSTVLNFENFKRREAKKTIKMIELYNLEREVQEGNSFQRMKARFMLSLKSMTLEYGKFIGTMKFMWLGFTKLLSFIGWAGVIFSVISVLKPLLDKFKDPAVLAFEEAQKKLIDKFKKQTAALTKLNAEMQRTSTLMAGIVQLSNFYGNFSYAGAAGAFGVKPTDTASRMTSAGQEASQVNAISMIATGGVQTAGSNQAVETRTVNTLGEKQIAILQETNKTLEIQRSRLHEGSTEYNEITGYIGTLEAALKASNSEFGITDAQVEIVNNALHKLGEEGTLAQQGLAGFASTTQILAGATQNFSNAMASLKARSTGLTQITDAISGVGSALTTLGTGDYSGYKDMDTAFKDVTDKGTLALARTFIGDDAVENILNSAKFTQQEKLAELGKQIEAEAKRLHQVEIGLMTDKMKIETQLIKDKKGMPALVAKQLDKEGKVKLLSQQILDSEILSAELKDKGNDKAAAQLVLEEQKLEKLKAQLEVAERASSFAFQAIDTFRGALTTGLTKAFEDFATGAKSMKDAFLDMTQAILKAMIQIIAQQAAIRIMGSFGFPMGRSGGVFSSPGYRSFAGGGIATGSKSGYPVTLHGTEAVVPLGNDRSIPVELKGGGAGSGANITVNVSTAGGQQTTSAGAGEKERKLGQMVAAAVQGELLDQQRPGGILSPFGDGGG